MKHLFGFDGQRSLARAMRRAPLLAFDFDGTFAPIVPRADHARMSRPVVSRLVRLAALRPVAIVTGRSVEDVSGRLGFQPHCIVGNHGAELDGAPSSPAASAALDHLRHDLDLRRDELQRAGVIVEDKRYSLALHYRLARDRDEAAACIDHLLRDLPPALRRFGGKCVANVSAADAPDKADAILALVRRAGAGAAVFVGDDINDEPVFGRAPAQWLTVRIGRDDPRSRAMFFLDSHCEVATLLDHMLQLLRSQSLQPTG